MFVYVLIDRDATQVSRVSYWEAFDLYENSIQDRPNIEEYVRSVLCDPENVGTVFELDPDPDGCVRRLGIIEI